MITKPKIGMRVTVDDRLHCCPELQGNVEGPGVIEYVRNDDSFSVQTDAHPAHNWFRCRACVTEIGGQVTMTTQTIKHPHMVKTLCKPGDTIAAELTGGEAHLAHMMMGISGEAGESVKK